MAESLNPLAGLEDSGLLTAWREAQIGLSLAESHQIRVYNGYEARIAAMEDIKERETDEIQLLVDACIAKEEPLRKELLQTIFDNTELEDFDKYAWLWAIACGIPYSTLEVASAMSSSLNQFDTHLKQHLGQPIALRYASSWHVGIINGGAQLSLERFLENDGGDAISVPLAKGVKATRTYKGRIKLIAYMSNFRVILPSQIQKAVAGSVIELDYQPSALIGARAVDSYRASLMEGSAPTKDLRVKNRSSAKLLGRALEGLERAA